MTRFVEHTNRLKLWIKLDPKLASPELFNEFTQMGGRVLEWPGFSFIDTVNSLKDKGYRKEVSQDYPRRHTLEFMNVAIVQHMKNCLDGNLRPHSYPAQSRSVIPHCIKNESDYSRFFNEWFSCESDGSLAKWFKVGDEITVINPDHSRVKATPAVYLSVAESDIPDNLLKRLSDQVITVTSTDCNGDFSVENILKTISLKV